MIDIKKIFNDYNLKDRLFDLINNCSLRAKEKLKNYSISKKEDGSLVTQADKDIDYTIRKVLSSFSPSIPVISEESNFNKRTFLEDIYWLVDPIDGTSSYVKGENSYTINIALVYLGSPILGIIANPPSETVWFGEKNEASITKGSFTKRIKTSTLNNNICKIITSKSFDYDTNNFIKKIENKSIEYCSSSIKFCRISEGKANLYPRLKSISKWDIAAGEAILKAAGGVVINCEGEALNYCTDSIETGKFFALSSQSLWKKIISDKLKND